MEFDPHAPLSLSRLSSYWVDIEQDIEDKLLDPVLKCKFFTKLKSKLENCSLYI